MSGGRIFIIAVLAGLGGCSWTPVDLLPSMPAMPSFGGIGSVTNPAVEACIAAASDKGLSEIGQQAATPQGKGRYHVQLQAREKNGMTQVSCDYDPDGGAKIEVAKPT